MPSVCCTRQATPYIGPMAGHLSKAIAMTRASVGLVEWVDDVLVDYTSTYYGDQYSHRTEVRQVPKAHRVVVSANAITVRVLQEAVIKDHRRATGKRQFLSGISLLIIQIPRPRAVFTFHPNEVCATPFEVHPMPC